MLTIVGAYAYRKSLKPFDMISLFGDKIPFLYEYILPTSHPLQSQLIRVVWGKEKEKEKEKEGKKTKGKCSE